MPRANRLGTEGNEECNIFQLFSLFRFLFLKCSAERTLVKIRRAFQCSPDVNSVSTWQTGNGSSMQIELWNCYTILNILFVCMYVHCWLAVSIFYNWFEFKRSFFCGLENCMAFKKVIEYKQLIQRVRESLDLRREIYFKLMEYFTLIEWKGWKNENVRMIANCNNDY